MIKKVIKLRFILVATLTFIPYTVLWFFWHNNLFYTVYYISPAVYSTIEQNIWAVNFANALLVYGFVYFYSLAVKHETKLLSSILWGIFYNISVIGFYSFLNLGMMREWNLRFMIYDVIFAVIFGAFSGLMVYYLYRRFYPSVRQEGTDG